MPKSQQLAFSCPVCKWVIVTHQAVIIGVSQDGQTVAPVDRETEVRALFAAFDEDESGQMDRTELTTLLEALNFPAPDELAGLFEAADLDSDGQLTWPEFTTFYNSLQQKMLRAAVVADIRITQQVLDAAKASVAEEHEGVNKGDTGNVPETDDPVARAKRLRERADALKKIQQDLMNAESNLQEETASAKEHSQRTLRKKLAARKEKMSQKAFKV